ncbi:MAG: putative metalloprotease CJM1_0395 family protein [Pseudomonadota bacterium]
MLVETKSLSPDILPRQRGGGADATPAPSRSDNAEGARRETGAIFAPALGEKALRALIGSSATEKADGASRTRQPGGDSDGARPSANDLTPAEQDLVDRLRARDQEVRAHEEAHARVGGQYAGSPSYTYQTGPDGKRYAIGGQVSIDVSPVPGDPEATIAKMDRVKAAALAPAEPSSADRRIATIAEAARRDAEAVLSAMRRLAIFEAAEGGRAVSDEPLGSTVPEPALGPSATETERPN